MMLSPAVVSYDAELSDFTAGYSLFKTTCKRSRRSIRNVRFFAVLWLVACGWGFATQPSVRTSPVAVGLTVASLNILFVLPWQERRSVKKQWGKIVTEPARTLPITITFDDQQISFLLTGKSEARFYWPAIAGIAEDDLTFLLLVAERQFYYIPKRILSADLLGALRSVAPAAKEFTC